MLLEVICVCGQVVACAPLLEPEASIGQGPCVYSVEATWSKRPLLPKGLMSVETTLDVTSLARGSSCTECKAPLGPQPFITELPGAERDSGRVGVW